MPPAVRSLDVEGRMFEFVHVSLEFGTGQHEDVFAGKNNKTLRETLEHRRYKSLAPVCEAGYAQHLDSPLGEVLLRLKNCGDSFYQRFLNRYGDLTYSTFSISDPHALDARGIYAYFGGQDLKYIGRCRDSMRKRVNQGYGKIHPKNCYVDGQATNCHLNALVTEATSDTTLWLCRLNDKDIEVVERALIRKYAPPWNIQRR